MIFIGMTMVYYGIILFRLRKILKIKDEKMASSENDIQVHNSIIKWDRAIFVGYGIIFALFNVAYFIKYAT